jgi:hypothetical protein
MNDNQIILDKKKQFRADVDVKTPSVAALFRAFPNLIESRISQDIKDKHQPEIY